MPSSDPFLAGGTNVFGSLRSAAQRHRELPNASGSTTG
ncbi:hypothetical protein BN903_24 [Halorubrum sp. AJ67]|nr:hypothetical protein BN903_24 [Halorubrum sp. AJ67]